MADYGGWIILGACAIVIVVSLGSVAGMTKRAKLSMSNQARLLERGEKQLALQAETNQLLRELIAAVRDKR